MVARALLVASIATSLACGVHLRGMGDDPKMVEAALRPPPVLEFSSNGCTGFREARFFSCCYTHDFDFWAGGSHGDRWRADLRLRRCVLDVSGYEQPVADFAFLLVRLEALAGLVVDDGWGRAWRSWRRGAFQALSPAQRVIVDRERRRICDGLALNPATGSYRVDDRREMLPAQAREFCSS